MSLSDPKYIGFLFAVFLLFYALPTGGPRRALLLIASYFFYFELSRFYIVVLFLVTAMTYWGALLLRSQDAARRIPYLFGLICALVLTPLIVFKYLGAFLGATGGGTGFGFLSSHLSALALPVGISFFTFAALGYLIDVYLEVLEPETRFPHVALFLAFFPLISAGPIERAGRFMPQFDLTGGFSADRAFSALRLILIGLVLKVCFADFLSRPVNTIYEAPANYSALEQFVGAFFYSFYLYADFAGYSLIAIGSAKLLGLEVRPNFLQPYLSTSVPEFWRRWHISLSSWVRDYLFSPLRMEWRNYGNWGMAGALLVSFVILGVWHGARWGWLAFGVIHGLLVIASTFTVARRNAIWTSLRVPPWVLLPWRTLYTFLLVTLAYVVYRANSMHDALEIYRSIFSLGLLRDFSAAFQYFALHHGPSPLVAFKFILPKGLAIILVIIICDILVDRKITLEKLPSWLQCAACNIAILFVLYSWLSGHISPPFFYYKF